jgi:hypothetical protein
MQGMPAIPESTKTSLAQRLRAHAKSNWPQLSTVHVHYRGQFAYVASKNSYEDQIWLTGTVEDALDLVCDLHVTNA